MNDSASYTQVTGKLDCNKCVWGTRDGGCASWECEFIDRDDAVKAWRNMPSAQPERKKGKWIDYSDEGYVECPFCHSDTNCDGNKDELHYCFSCGADMRGEQDE